MILIFISLLPWFACFIFSFVFIYMSQIMWLNIHLIITSMILVCIRFGIALWICICIWNWWLDKGEQKKEKKRFGLFVCLIWFQRHFRNWSLVPKIGITRNRKYNVVEPKFSSSRYSYVLRSKFWNQMPFLLYIFTVFIRGWDNTCEGQASPSIYTQGRVLTLRTSSIV